MITRDDRATGLIMSTGEMNAKRFADEIGVAHGTVKRWLHEGMPARREKEGQRGSHGTWIDPAKAKAWLEERFKGRKTIAFERRSFVYLAEREDGAIKIGWSSDPMRRVFELRRYMRSAVQLVALFPGDKRVENALHERFRKQRIEGEWYSAGGEVAAFVKRIEKAGKADE